MKPVSDDLLDVILKDKPMGYLPLKTIKAARISLDKTKKLCKENNISFKIINQEKCKRVASGVFVCWKEEEVSKVLKDNKKILIKEKIPVDTISYINYIFNNDIDQIEQPQGFQVCGYLYGSNE